MSPRRRWTYLVLALTILAAVSLACGTGYQTSSKIVGNSGEVRVKLKDASGANSTSIEINEDWFRERIAAAATLSLESGSCRAVLRGENGSQLILQAAGGSPAEAYGELVTDSFGEVGLETDCQAGQNLELLIAFSR